MGCCVSKQEKGARAKKELLAQAKEARELAENFRTAAEELDKVSAKWQDFQKWGNVANVTGNVVACVGVILVPFTGGASLGLSKLGFGASVLGLGASGVSTVVTKIEEGITWRNLEKKWDLFRSKVSISGDIGKRPEEDIEQQLTQLFGSAVKTIGSWEVLREEAVKYCKGKQATKAAKTGVKGIVAPLNIALLAFSIREMVTVVAEIREHHGSSPMGNSFRRIADGLEAFAQTAESKAKKMK